MQSITDSGKLLYNRAKIWQIGLFSLNTTSVSLYNMMMGYMVYYASGVLGLGVAVVSTLLMSMRIFDGIIDPFVGWFIDRTNGRFGKFRPFMVFGNAVMMLALTLIYFSQFAGAAKIPLFIFAYLIYILGYSSQHCITRAALAVLTNDPKQRPIFSAFDMVTTVFLLAFLSMLVSNYLIVKHGGFTGEMFGEFFRIIIICSVVCLILAVIGIWQKDRREFLDIAEKTPKIKLRDGMNVLFRNRSLQMLMISAGTDKLFGYVSINSVIGVIIYGIICGNYALAGRMTMYLSIPMIIVALCIIQYARKAGQKEAFLLGSYGGIIFSTFLLLLFVFGDPTTLSFTNIGVFSILFVIFLSLRSGLTLANTSIIIPMIADCTDYELTRSGKYLPGTIGALFTCIEQLSTSFTNALVGMFVILAGFKASYPTVDTQYTTGLFWVGMICYCGLPILGWIINIICMRFYPLSKAKMAEIQQTIRNIKEETNND